MREYTVIYERANDGGWGAYVPDLPGLGVIGETRDEAHQLIVDGIKLHIAGLKEDGLPIPEPVSYAGSVQTEAA
jgi:predicted RNase H-like HicB family nuclease